MLEYVLLPWSSLEVELELTRLSGQRAPGVGVTGNMPKACRAVVPRARKCCTVQGSGRPAAGPCSGVIGRGEASCPAIRRQRCRCEAPLAAIIVPQRRGRGSLGVTRRRYRQRGLPRVVDAVAPDTWPETDCASPDPTCAAGSSCGKRPSSATRTGPGRSRSNSCPL